MKRILFLYLLLCSVLVSRAQQPYLNEWIDYSKTYYKFKVGPFGYDAVSNPIIHGVVRINQTTLAAAGLGTVPAENFQLWKDGQEVPIYVSNVTGQMASNDYIEFWGEIATGKADKYLFKDSTYQLSDVTSLETDSASYFLTVNTIGSNKRFANTANNVSGTSLSPETNFMYTTTRNYRGYINYGFGIFVEERLYASDYDTGEGLGSPTLNAGSPKSWTFSSLYADMSGSPITFRMDITGSAPNARNINVLMNGQQLTNFSMGYFQIKHLEMTGIPVSNIQSDAAAFTVQDITSATDDDTRLGRLEMVYPRKFNFGAASSFEFYITASAQGRYLKIANFNKGTAQAVLLDITNGKRYYANTSITDTLQFVLDPSVADYHLVLIRDDGSTAKTISQVQQRPFTNFANIANQSNYVIISNPLLYGSGAGNYVQQYADYRSSDSGGKFNARVIDIHDLEDQFAWGIKMHPLAIKNFLRYARNTFIAPPQFAFLVGKGVTYDKFRTQETNPQTIALNMVPVWGTPGSDNMLAADGYDPIPATPIGRLSVVTPDEVGVYLQKVKEYESAQRDTSWKSIADNLWKKKVLQLAGANDVSIEQIIDTIQTKYTQIITSPSFGADVKTYSKTTSTGSEYGKSVMDFTNEYNDGSAMIEYLGHSSSTSIDFSLDNPANYSNAGKYPLFIVNGCLAGNIFDFDVNRYLNRSTLSEKFVLEPERGAIGYLSSSNFGVLNYLDIFTEQFYKSITTTQYGNSFGTVMQEGIANGLNYTGVNDFYGRMHAEQLTFHGDPAIKISSFDYPDYAVDTVNMIVTPGYLSVASDSFTVKVNLFNLGKAITDSVHFKLERTYPDGNKATIYSGNLPPLNNEQILIFNLPIVSNRDKGTTIITASVDDANALQESREYNNSASVPVYISAADLLPVSPYNYSIITSNKVNLVTSTAYPLSPSTQYVLEMDTTSLFNSPEKITKQIIATGGIIEFDSVALSLDNTVYFWRVSEDSAVKHWNTYSFTHRSTANNGFEQAHFLQHTNSLYNGLSADSTARTFEFGKEITNLFITHSIYPTSGTEDNHFSISENGTFITWSACVGHSIIFNVFDPKTLKPIPNLTLPYNSGPNNCKDTLSLYNFEYSTLTSGTRKNAMDFMDNYIQNGYYVVVRKIYDLGDADWAPTIWAKDTALYGHNNSLYHRLKDVGAQIDSFTYPRTFIFMYKKNDSATYKTVSVLSNGLYDRISLSQNFNISDTTGIVTSPAFGPGKSWNKVTWTGNAVNGNVTASMDVIAEDTSGVDTVLYTIDKSQTEQDISSLDANVYPYVKLRMHTKDQVTVTPYQLQDWKVEFTPVPEGAIATNLGLSIPDELDFDHDINQKFDTLQGYIIFKNISNTAFDPLKVKLIMYDAANNPYAFSINRTRALPAGDTVYIPFLLDVRTLPQGQYNLFIEVNPDNDQPEQYHYNNSLYQYVTINRNGVLSSNGLSFSAKPVNQTVHLEWTIHNDINLSGYEVEYSADGVNFSSIGYVQATAYSSENKSYSFIHSTPQNGKNYYRIKLLNKDGKISYSAVKEVIIVRSNVIVFPNPFKNQLNILVKQSDHPLTVKLSDLTGRTIMQQNISANTSLVVGNYAKGVYILQVIDGAQVYTFRLVKQ